MAAGLAARLGIEITVVRIGLVLAALASSGLAVAAYVIGWLVIPTDGETTAIARRAASDRRGIALAVALVPGLAVVLLLASALHAGWLGSIAWATFVSAAGLVLVVRNLGAEERTALERVTLAFARFGIGGARPTRALVRRALVGGALILAGAVALSVGRGQTVLRPFGGVVLVIAGFVVIFGPWWLSLARELVAERQARARAEERAELAARLHDSELQTLALIQRRAGDPHEVVKLARSQERELRQWLFSDAVVPADAASCFSVAVRRIHEEVEDAHGVPIDAVVVGDCPLKGPDGERLQALLAAGREATVNAVKWSEAPVVSLFAEVEPDAVSLYVRDRGIGFDPATVAPDRQGLAESIHGRMGRHGGTAEVRSTPGAGTEVRLRIERTDRAAAPGGRAGGPR